MVTANVEITKGFFEKTIDNINTKQIFFWLSNDFIKYGCKIY